MTIRPVANPIRLVQREINQSLEQAAALFDTNVSSGIDTFPWEQCREYLEEVHGALIMLDIVGGIRLCEECLSMINALQNKSTLSQNQSMDLLVYSILLLPRYLERARNQKRELPETLLPTLNALRALRRCVLLPDYEFADFKHVDTSLPTLADETQTPSTDLDASTRRLRHIYQVGLLGLFRKPDSAVHAKQLRRALGRLCTAFGDSVTSRWLRLAATLTDHNLTNRLAFDASMRLMFSRIDLHVKNAMRDNPDKPPQELVCKALLYYTLHGGEANAELRSLRKDLGLSRALTMPAMIEHERETMAAPDRSVMQAVGLALAEDMERLKATIETLSQLNSVTASEREDLAEQLSSLSHTMTLLGLSETATQLNKAHTSLQSLGEDATVDRLWELLQSTAETLTQGEEAVHSLSVTGRSVSGQKRPERLRAAEHQAITECLVNLGRARQALEFLNGDVDEGEDIALVSPLIQDVANIMKLMCRNEVATLLENAGTYLVQLTSEHQGSEPLAALADTLAAAEWYLEGLMEDSENSHEALEIGDQALKTLKENGLPTDPARQTM